MYFSESGRFLCVNTSYFIFCFKSWLTRNMVKPKQEAHGPHCSPESEQFKSINTYDYIITLIKKRKNNIINFMRIYWFFV